MKVTDDTRADAVHSTVRDGRVSRTVELAPEVHLDVDRRGRPLYLEILGARKKLGPSGVGKVLFSTVGQKH